MTLWSLRVFITSELSFPIKVENDICLRNTLEQIAGEGGYYSDNEISNDEMSHIGTRDIWIPSFLQSFHRSTSLTN